MPLKSLTNNIIFANISIGISVIGIVMQIKFIAKISVICMARKIVYGKANYRI